MGSRSSQLLFPTLLGTVCVLAACLLGGCQPLAQPADEPDAAGTPAPAPGAEGLGDRYAPGLGNGGYDVQHYTIALDVEPMANIVTGTTTITARATQALSAFNLDFADLPIDAVTVDGGNVAYAHDGNELTITPSVPLADADLFTMVVAYHGSPVPIPSLAGDTIGWFHSPSGAINVIGEPDGAQAWFPANDYPRDKATFRFEITVPAPYVVAAPGVLLNTEQAGDRIRYVWEMDQPMATYLAAVNIDKYDVETAAGPDGVEIRNYFPHAYPAAQRQRYAVLPQMVEYFSKIFGPYPYAAYGVLIADPEAEPCHFMLAEETPMLSTHCAIPRAADEEVVAHELAHQWFGDSVSLANWEDVWLKEGLATYGQWLWGTRDQGMAALNEAAAGYLSDLHLTSPIAQPSPGQLYNAGVYTGGALVFHALRLKVGDETFFKILRAYYERYKGSSASTQDFIAVAEEVSGQELSPFFSDWLYTFNLPALPGN
jgi:aminopeptidase N